MKEYRLASWPELKAPFHRTPYRRMLSDMSHRFVTLPQLSGASGLRRLDVRNFVDMLQARGLLMERECVASDSLFAVLAPLSGWLKRAMSPAVHER